MNLSLTNLLKNLTNVISSGITDWGSIHPVINHFPIVLLFIAPFFILLGLIFQKSNKPFYISALVLMLLGTLTLFLAVSSGNHAAERLKPNPQIVSALDAHVRLGEQARLNFSILSSIFLLYVVFHSKLTQKFNRKTNVIAVSLFLITYSFNLVVLFNTAHYGGELVHKHGINSTLYSNTD